MNSTEIRELRMTLKMTRQELADAIGIDPVTVARWETNHRRPGRLAERRLARLSKRNKLTLR